ncbi:GNAT family N-acetyltransferase [Microbulbifer sp. GL-2]|uniref:GNAT family N-acetyltransferase n=1 Tax=Microbulbifer sp. GL-2 TaxID=2591606 RepID=UPI001163955E|nr:GNAT family protein [Microbulbifer sp. GL-2]BBM01517.1 ribosomal-protein-serine acetyltransferase [Microbulbifer sp. GL-2]
MQISVTENILLQPLAIADAQEIHLLIEQNRCLLAKYLYWVESIKDLTCTREYLYQRIYSKNTGAAWYKIIVEEKVSGIFGIKAVNPRERCAEIGYWLSTHCQGRGVMTKVVEKICAHLKKSQGIQQLSIQCLSENKASIAIAKRVGGVHTDTVANYYTIDGKVQDLKLYTVAL